MYKLLPLLFVIFIGNYCKAQFNAFANNPFQEQIQIEAQEGSTFFLSYRNQWPWAQTTFQGLQGRYQFRKDRFLLGGSLQKTGNNKVGIASTKVLLNGGYIQKLNANSFISFSASAGIAQFRVAENLTFSNQFDGSSFDANLATGEDMSSSSLITPEINTLLGYIVLTAKERLELNAQMEISNLTQSGISFYQNSAVSTPMQFGIRTKAMISINERVSSSSTMMSNFRGSSKEFILGQEMGYRISDQTTLALGVGYRFGDAMLFSFTTKIHNAEFALNYETNTSGFGKGLNNSGAVELQATYNLKHNTSRFVSETSELESEIIDSDQDGIPDIDDVCPLMPGFAKYNGCRDTDKDGIWDQLDACPNIAGSSINNGCPLKHQDSDRDGIPDWKDDCPYLTGAPAHAGCPDTDKDGIQDIEDSCPYVKGTPLNLGCPDMAKSHDAVPESLEQESNKSTESLIVYFDSDESRIKHTEMRKLEDFISSYIGLDASFYIAGHTDFEGDSEYNYALSQRRNRAVQLQLNQYGIKNITQLSFGELNPVESNFTESGKALNRRVEIRVIY